MMSSSQSQGGRKGVVIWSKKKVDEDAKAYHEKIKDLCKECPAFNNGRNQLSVALEQDFADVLQMSGKKQPVLQEMDQISTIYAHSEFVNNLFHDELTRIKDKCLADIVSHTASPAPAAAASGIASTQIHASPPSLSRVSSSSPQLSRSASAPAQSREGAPHSSSSSCSTRFTALATHAHAASAVQSVPVPRFIAENTGAALSPPKVSPSANGAPSAAAAKPAIELLRGPLKRPDRAISKVIVAQAYCTECWF